MALNTRRFFIFATCILGSIVLLRGLTLDALDLIDPTESRYAFVAQEMVESGDWLTPKVPLPSGVTPYLGKPPLHFWLTALSYRVFGIHECTSRLPSFLSYLCIAFFVALFARRFFGATVAALSALIVLSSGLLFFLSAGSVVDVTLTACITGAIVSFAFCIEARDGRSKWGWGCLFFIMTALAVLTKGPVGIALIGFPLTLWMLHDQRLKDLRQLPWGSGILFFSILVLPWFLLEEHAQPGFLKYFFFNENFGRYFIHDYGDRYGTGHRNFRGSAWWMLLVSFLPWSVLWIIALSKNFGSALSVWKSIGPWTRLALLWGLTPAIFFSFARQVNFPYVLPGVGGLAVLTSVLIHHLSQSASRKMVDTFFLSVSLVSLAAAIGSIIAGLILGSALFSLSLSLFLLCLMLWTFKRSRTSDLHSLELGSLSTGLVAGTFAVFTLCGGTYASYRKSTQAILREVTRGVQESALTVGIVQSNAYSSYFYGRAWQGQLEKPVNIIFVDASNPLHTGPAHIIARVKELTGGEYAPFFEHYKIVKSLGRWAWFERESSPSRYFSSTDSNRLFNGRHLHVALGGTSH